MVEDAKFWVVEPRITLSGVSGLSTLLSGNYIGFEAGKSNEAAAQLHRARGAADHHRRQPGRQFVLKAENLGSLGIGSPIYYRRLQVGQVIAYDLAPDGKSVEITIFVNAPYDKYVNPGHALLERERRRRIHSARTASTCARSRWSRCSRAASPSTRRPSPPRPSPLPRTRSSRSIATGPPR